jgi:hypothetical protein
MPFITQAGTVPLLSRRDTFSIAFLCHCEETFRSAKMMTAICVKTWATALAVEVI